MKKSKSFTISLVAVIIVAILLSLKLLSVNSISSLSRKLHYYKLIYMVAPKRQLNYIAKYDLDNYNIKTTDRKIESGDISLCLDKYNYNNIKLRKPFRITNINNGEYIQTGAVYGDSNKYFIVGIEMRLFKNQKIAKNELQRQLNMTQTDAFVINDSCSYDLCMSESNNEWPITHKINLWANLIMDISIADECLSDTLKVSYDCKNRENLLINYDIDRKYLDNYVKSFGEYLTKCL
jgi:hypothetical protein